jgi:hypothetical protein
LAPEVEVVALCARAIDPLEMSDDGGGMSTFCIEIGLIVRTACTFVFGASQR